MAARVQVVSTGATARPGADDAVVFDGIVLPALPLPFTFRPARPLTDEELLEFAGDNSGVDFEVDADGTVAVMPPSKPKGSRLNQIFAAELMLWARQAGLGEVFGPDLGVRFDDGVLRSPDAAWLSAKKWRAHNERAGDGREFLTVCPEFVAELRSPGDRASKVEAKMEFWMSRGAELGWLIDPVRALAMLYTPGDAPRTLLRPEFLEGEGPVAGLRIEMREFWKQGLGVGAGAMVVAQLVGLLHNHKMRPQKARVTHDHGRAGERSSSGGRQGKLCRRRYQGIWRPRVRRLRRVLTPCRTRCRSSRKLSLPSSTRPST